MGYQNDKENFGLLVGSLVVVIFVLCLLGFLSKSKKHEYQVIKKPGVTVTNVSAVKTVVTNNAVTVHGEKKEKVKEEVVVCSTSMPVAVFTADKSKLKKHLQKKLAEEQNKKVN